MAEAALLHTQTIIQWFTEKGIPVHPNFAQVKGELAAQMSDQSFIRTPGHDPDKSCRRFLPTSGV